MNKKFTTVIETIIIGALVFVLTFTNAFGALDYIAKDSLYQIPRGIDSNIKIIGIDEKSLNEYGPIQTWSRSKYTDLIKTLNSGEGNGPLLIGFDIQFSGNVDEGDAAFAKAAEEAGNVVVVNHLIYKTNLEIGRGPITGVDSVEEPYDSLRAVCDAGFSNVSQDSDGLVRRIVPEENCKGQDYKMFSSVLYEKYCEITGTKENEIPVDKYGRSIINYSGRPGDYEYVSLYDVLNGNIDSRAFSDSIVLVGAYAPGMQDNFEVPNGGSTQMYGVEIHANILQSYMEGRFAVNGNPIILGLITALIAIILHLLFKKLKVWQSLIILVIAIVAEVLILSSINEHGYAFSVIYFPIVIIASFVYSIVAHYLIERARKKKVLNAFRKYVAPEIVEEISKKGDFEIKVGGEN